MVQECECCASLFQRRQGVALGLGDVFEEPANLAEAQVARMLFVMEQDKPARPVCISFSRLRLTKVGLCHLTDQVKQPRSLRSRRIGRQGHGEPPKQVRIGRKYSLVQNAGQAKLGASWENCLTAAPSGL